jgi:SOS-response transcriptional repressor LexA
MATTEMKPLTDKQRRVFDLLSEGKTQSEIANEMGIRSLSGVASHVEALRKKGYLDANGAPTAQPDAKAPDKPEPDKPDTPDISGDDEPPAEASANGYPAFDLTEQENSLRSAVDGIDKALAEMEAASETLRKQRDKADKALEALAAIS